MFYFLGVVFFRFVFNVFYKSKIVGRENIPSSGAIIAPNHVSFLDPPFIGQSHSRPMYFFAKRKLYDKKVLGFLLRRLHTYPIDRGEKSAEAMKIASDLLARDQLVVLYPEGTRTSNGDLGTLKRGVARLALKNGVPIVPTWVGGLYEAWPRNKIFPTPFLPVSCVYGKPIDPEQYAHLPREEAIEAILAELRKRMIGLIPIEKQPRSIPK